MLGDIECHGHLQRGQTLLVHRTHVRPLCQQGCQRLQRLGFHRALKKKKEKKEVVGVLRRAVDMQRRLREPGVGNRAGLARTLGVSRAHISQSMAVLDVPGRLMDTLVRAEKSGRPVTVGAWRKVKGLPEEAAIGKLREMGYP